MNNVVQGEIIYLVSYLAYVSYCIRAVVVKIHTLGMDEIISFLK